MGLMPLASGAVGVAILLALLWAAWVSRAEGEPQATVRLGLMGLLHYKGHQPYGDINNEKEK